MPSSSTRRSGCTSSTSPGPPTRPRTAGPAASRARSGSGPSSSASSTRWSASRRSSATTASTSSPPTSSGEAFYSPQFDDPTRPVNSARFVFLNPQATEFFLDWDTIANDCVSILRAEAGRDPYDKRLSDLIGELSTRSDEFRVRWAAHDVKLHRTGVKRFHHPVVGDLTLDFETLDLPGDPGQKVLMYSAEPGSPSQEALDLLASWASTDPAAPTPEEQPWRR